MPKIIHKGTKKGTVYRSNCSYCGCIAEYEEKEVDFDSGQPTHSPTAKCPQCSKNVSLQTLLVILR